MTKLNTVKRVAKRRRRAKEQMDLASAMIAAVVQLARLERDGANPGPLLGAIGDPEEWLVDDWSAEVGLARAYLGVTTNLTHPDCETSERAILTSSWRCSSFVRFGIVRPRVVSLQGSS